MWLRSAVIALAACGRVGFVPFGGGDDSGDGDGGPDTMDEGPINPVAHCGMDDDPTTGTPACSPAGVVASCITCPTSTAGARDGAYAFAGGSYVKLQPTTLIGSPPYSVAFWMKPPTTFSNSMSIVTKPYSPTTTFNVFSVWIDNLNGTNVFETTVDGTSLRVIGSPVDLRDGAWHHIVATVDATDMKRFYVDGVLRSMAQATLGDGSELIYVGIDFDLGNPVNAYTGALDDLRIYHRALTQADIDALFAN